MVSKSSRSFQSPRKLLSQHCLKAENNLHCTGTAFFVSYFPPYSAIYLCFVEDFTVERPVGSLYRGSFEEVGGRCYGMTLAKQK